MKVHKSYTKLKCSTIFKRGFVSQFTSTTSRDHLNIGERLALTNKFLIG